MRRKSEPTTILARGATAILVAWLVAMPDAAVGADAGDTSVDSAANTASFEVSIEQSFQAPDAVPPGEPVTLSVAVEHPSGANVRAEPALEESRWNHVTTDRSVGRSEGRVTTTLNLTLQVFRVGTATLEPIDIVVTGADGGRRTLRTEPVDLRVDSVLGDDDQPTLRPARGPHAVWTHDYTLAWVGGGMAAAVALGTLAFVFLFFVRDDEPIAAAAPSKPPEEEALDALRELAESDLLERGDVMYFYVRMSQTIRRYLGRRFGFPGTEWTTSEILDRMDQTSWHGDVTRDDIADWMHRVDLVKFTGRIPTADEARDALDRARHLVRETRPPEAEE